MDIKEHIDDLIVKCLGDEATKAEVSELKTWAKESPENMDYLRSYCLIWEGTAVYGDSADAEKAFDKFCFKTGAFSRRNTGKVKTWVIRAVGIAAAVVLVAFISFRQGSNSIKETFADIVVEAPAGSRTNMTLPDGTKVSINSGSSITYSQGFGVDNRNVHLSGECYLEVAKNEGLPFTISSDNLSVRVLGTKFNFRDYPEDTDASVALLEGSIALNNLMKDSDGETIMFPNQKILLDKSNGSITLDTVEKVEDNRWTEGRMVFEEIQLSQIAKILERQYGVIINIEGEGLGELRFYGIFSSPMQSLTDVLDILSATKKFKYKISGKTVSIYT